MSLSPFPHVQPCPGKGIQQLLIESNRREYGLKYDLLTFAGPARLATANAERTELLQWLDQHAAFGYSGTKVDCSGLSPGCRRCGGVHDDLMLELDPRLDCCECITRAIAGFPDSGPSVQPAGAARSLPASG